MDATPRNELKYEGNIFEEGRSHFGGRARRVRSGVHSKILSQEKKKKKKMMRRRGRRGRRRRRGKRKEAGGGGKTCKPRLHHEILPQRLESKETHTDEPEETPRAVKTGKAD